MTRKSPPDHTRFRKGHSGNPKGRPKARSAKIPSAFDIVIDRTLSVTQDGQPRAVTVEEALQHRTYQQAVAGSRPDRREILKMIARRERWLAERRGADVPMAEWRTEQDPENADAALLILGVASRNPNRVGPRSDGEQLLLEPWAVQMALGRRRGGARLSQKDRDEVERCTRDPTSLRWPQGSGR